MRKQSNDFSKDTTFLNGIKGISAVVVIIFHFLSAVYPSLVCGQNIKAGQEYMLSIAASPLNILYDGNLSVAFFFVISGFVLSISYFRDGKSTVVDSLIKRYFRLMPPILFSSILVLVSLTVGINHTERLSSITSSVWLASFYKFKPSMLMAFMEGIGGMVWNHNTYNPTLWALYYEFWGVAVVLVILEVMKRTNLEKSRYVIYIIILIAMYNTYFLGFVLGVWLCDMVYGDEIKTLRKISGLVLIVGTWIASYPAEFPVQGTIYEWMRLDSLGHAHIAMFWHFIGSFLILLALFHMPKISGIFRWKPFLWLGSISYSMYVFGFLFQNTLFAWIFIKFWEKGYFGKGFLAATLVTLLLLVVCSYISSRTIEQIGKRIGKLVADKIIMGGGIIECMFKKNIICFLNGFIVEYIC